MNTDRPDDDNEQALTSPAQVDAAVSELCSQAKHYIHVRSPRLEFSFFKSADLLHSLTPLITADQRNHIHVLIDDDIHFLSSNARLIELARKFTSYVTVRKLPPEYSESGEIFIVTGKDSYLYMKSASSYPASLGSNSPRRVRQLDNRFEQLWERGERIAALYTLGL